MSSVGLFDISISNIDCRYIDTFEKYSDIDIDIDMVIFENIDIDKANLKNIDIDKEVLENIDIDKEILENIDIDIDKEILENINIDIDIDKKILENINIDIDKGIIKISIKEWIKMSAKYDNFCLFLAYFHCYLK